MAKKTAYIGLGSNLGERKASIDGAIKMLADVEQVEVVRVSDTIETAALADGDQPDYLNAVAELKTALSAEALHKVMVDIENLLGRTRRGKWSSRTIDLDLLLYGDEIIDGPDLTVPHAQMYLRSFVLRGLCQLDGDLVHPILKESISELAGRLNGCDFALDRDMPQLVSIAGVIGVGKTTLAKKLADRLGCEVLFEPYDTNPFMPDVYAGRKELALDSQLYFLTGRAEQLDRDVLSTGPVHISDYVFDKELIYARRLLDGRQLALYETIYPPLAARVAPPILVIYMRNSPWTCLERIHSRNRPYEQQIELPFLEALHSDYERLFADWKICPVIRISKLDDADVDHLVNQIKYYTSGHFVIAGDARPSKI